MKSIWHGVRLLSQLLLVGGCADALALPIEWKVEDGGNGHSYQVVITESGVGWHEADELSRAMGGHLATITSSAEDEFVFSLFESDESAFVNGFGPWIGLFQDPSVAEPDLGWEWVTGEELSYTNWAPGEPIGGDEDFGHYFRQAGGWNDAQDYWRFNYVVEYPRVPSLMGDFNTDGVVDSLDMDLLGKEIAAGTDNVAFDLNDDQVVDRTDRDIFLGGDLISSGNKINGDADFDGAVQFSDFVILSSYFGLKNRRWTQGDFDVNGDIEFPDFVILSGNFDRQSAASAAVPEPAGLRLAFLAIGAMAIQRKKR